MPDRIRIKPNQSHGVPWSPFGRGLFQTWVDSGRRPLWWPGILFATCLTVFPMVVSAVPESESPADLTAAPIEVLSESGRYVIEYNTAPNPIPRNEMFEMRVTVREPLKNGPAAHVSLEVDAGMPGHGHGMNTLPVVKGSPTDGFQVQGMCLHMAGDWELIFTIRRGVMSDRGVAQVHVE